MILKWIQHWDTWWTRPVPPHSLALIRIIFGLYLLWYWALHLPRAELLFSTSGLVVPMFPELAGTWLHSFFLPLSPVWTWVIYLSVLPCILLFTLGWDMRTNALIIALYFLYYYQLSFHMYPNTYNRLYFFLLIVLAFSGADRVYSLRMQYEHGSWDAWQEVSIWPLRLIAIQITATFTGVSYQKLWLPMWQQGEAMSYPLIGCWGSPIAYWIVRQNWSFVFYEIDTKILKFVQCAMPICFWIPKLRLIGLVAAGLFLVMVSTILTIWWFLILIPCFIVFLPPEQIAKTCQLKSGSTNRKIRLDD